MMRRLVRQDIEIVLALDADAGLVHVDPGQLEQVLVNLVVNASDAMPDGGTLSIESRAVTVDTSSAFAKLELITGPHVVIAVRDTGEGIDPEDLPHVFEPFFTTKAFGKGTGLGLATVHGIVRQSGGDVAASSTPGAGTTFEIYLPRVGRSRVPAATAATTGEDVVRGGSETVLVCDDYGDVLGSARSALEQFGFTVLGAKGPTEALRIADGHEGTIELLLTDIVMPIMDGRHLAESIRTRRPEIRVLFMSGHASPGFLDAATDPGINFIEKPFTPVELVRRVRAVIDDR